MTESEITPQELMKQLREEILSRKLSNSENYDKAVLSLATAFLGFSLAFLKDISGFHIATFRALLPTSWALFGLAIILTTISFFVSQAGLDRQLEIAEKYYLGGDQNALAERNSFTAWTARLNIGSGISFISAILCTIIFCSLNLPTGELMTNKGDHFQKGADIPKIQPVSTPKPGAGADIPPIQKLPPTPPPPKDKK